MYGFLIFRSSTANGMQMLYLFLRHTADHPAYTSANPVIPHLLLWILVNHCVCLSYGMVLCRIIATFVKPPATQFWVLVPDLPILRRNPKICVTIVIIYLGAPVTYLPFPVRIKIFRISDTRKCVYNILIRRQDHG